MPDHAEPDYTELAPGFRGRAIAPQGTRYATALALLAPGESLYALHDQAIKVTPVPISNEEDLRRTDEQHGSGLSLSYYLAAAKFPRKPPCCSPACGYCRPSPRSSPASTD